MPLASPGLWRMSLPAVSFMDDCQPLLMSSVRCQFHIYSHFSLYPPPTVNLLMNSAFGYFFWSCFRDTLFHWQTHDRCLGALMPWYQGWEGQSAPRSAGSLCPLHHARLQSVSSVLSAKQALHFPLGSVAFAIFSSLIKVRRAGAD